MSTANAIIDERSARIAGLHVCMSPGAMLAALRSDWLWAQHHQLEITACTLERVYPRRNDEFLLEYSLDVQGPEGHYQQPLLAELVGSDVAARRDGVVKSLRTRRRGQLPKKGQAEQVGALPGLGLVLRLPGLDERLPGLRVLRDREMLGAEIRGVTGQNSVSLPDNPVDVLGHRLGKRCIARCHFDHGNGSNSRQSLVVKLYKARATRGQAVFELMQELSQSGFDSDAPLRIPQPLAWSDDLKMLWMEDMPAVPLPDLPAQQHAAAVGRAGELLAKLHKAPVSISRYHTVDDEVALLTQWVRLVSEVHPHLAAGVQAGLVRVSAGLEVCRKAPVLPSHRDFYEKQVLIANDFAGLLDFDTLCLADPALDIGNFLAHLKLVRLQGIGRFSGAEDRFICGYGITDPGLALRITHWQKATLLRLVCLYSFWPRWTEVCAPLLERVHA